MKIFRNLFQVSTIKALLVLLAAFGVNVDGGETLAGPVSQVGLFVWAAWEAMRNEQQSGKLPGRP